MKEPYAVKLEITGPAAMFTRPDSGGGPISYQSPTHSALVDLFRRFGTVTRVEK